MFGDCMNYNANIGNVITEARKKKGISQNDLAKKLFVTRQAISNWENGKAFPDISVIFKLCKILDIDIRKIADMDKNIKIEQVIEVEKKKTNRRNLLFISIIIIIFLAIITTLVIVINRNMFVVYNVSLDSDEFTLDNSLLIKSKVKNYFQFGNLISKLDITDENTHYNIRIYKIVDDSQRLIFSGMYKSNISIMEDYGYGEYFDDLDADLSNIHLEISFIEDNHQYVYDYKLDIAESFKNNKLLYLKDDAGGELLSDYSSDTNVNVLFTSGYEYVSAKESFVKNIADATITIYPQIQVLSYLQNISNSTLLIQYFVKQNRFDVSIYSLDGRLIESYDTDEKNVNFPYNYAIEILKEEALLLGSK